MDEIYPLKIKLLKEKDRISITFNDKQEYKISSELLRVESPSAEVQGHGGGKVLLRNKEFVRIEKIEQIGNYAVRIIFTDGHNSGLYTWTKLLEFGKNHDQMLKIYKNKCKEINH